MSTPEFRITETKLQSTDDPSLYAKVFFNERKQRWCWWILTPGVGCEGVVDENDEDREWTERYLAEADAAKALKEAAAENALMFKYRQAREKFRIETLWRDRETNELRRVVAVALDPERKRVLVVHARLPHEPVAADAVEEWERVVEIDGESGPLFRHEPQKHTCAVCGVSSEKAELSYGDGDWNCEDEDACEKRAKATR